MSYSTHIGQLFGAKDLLKTLIVAITTVPKKIPAKNYEAAQDLSTLY